MTSSVLPSASFSFATRFNSPMSAAGGGIAATASRRTSAASFTNSGEKKSATISRSGLPVNARRSASCASDFFPSLTCAQPACTSMRERRCGSLAAEAALSNLSAALRNWPALTAFRASFSSDSEPSCARTGAARRRSAAREKAKENAREKSRARFTNEILAIPSSTRYGGSRTSRLHRRRPSSCRSCSRRGSR